MVKEGGDPRRQKIYVKGNKGIQKGHIGYARCFLGNMRNQS
jgi:hypothetical protein